MDTRWLPCVAGGRLRSALAALSFAATGLAVVGATGALARGGPTRAAPLAAVGAAGILIGLSTLAGRRWALAVSLLLAAAQPAPAVASAWELARGIPAVRRQNIQALGLAPTLGVSLNLLYSLAGSILAAWALTRLLTICRRPPPHPDTTGDRPSSSSHR